MPNNIQKVSVILIKTKHKIRLAAGKSDMRIPYDSNRKKIPPIILKNNLNNIDRFIE
jgi:hypothetical protein